MFTLFGICPRFSFSEKIFKLYLQLFSQKLHLFIESKILESKYKYKKKTAISGFFYSILKNLIKHYDFLDFLDFLELQQDFSEPSVLQDAFEAVVLQLDLEEEVS